jgi:hypothetical protein
MVIDLISVVLTIPGYWPASIWFQRCLRAAGDLDGVGNQSSEAKMSF